MDVKQKVVFIKGVHGVARVYVCGCVGGTWPHPGQGGPVAGGGATLARRACRGGDEYTP